MNPEAQEPKKNFSKDLKTFDRLPEMTKQLALLKDEAEKTIGPESCTLNKKIRSKSS